MLITGAYALCGTPRTAGTFLCDRLAAAGLGEPSEYLHPVISERTRLRWGVDRSDYLAELWKRKTAGGVFGIRLHWPHRDASYLVADWQEALPPGVPAVWVLLTRRDERAQAASFLTCLRDDVWHPPRPHADDLDERDVAMIARRFARQNDDWRRWLGGHLLPYLHLEHERVVADPDAAVAAVRAALAGAS